MPVTKQPYSREQLLKFTTNALSSLNAQRKKALRRKREHMQRTVEQQQMQATEQQEYREG